MASASGAPAGYGSVPFSPAIAWHPSSSVANHNLLIRTAR